MHELVVAAFAVAALMQSAGAPAQERDAGQAEVTVAPLWRSEAFHTNETNLSSGSGPQASFSPDSKAVAVCAAKQVELRGARDGKVIKRLGPHPYETFSVRWSPDGALLAVAMLGETSSWGNQPTEIKPAWREQSVVYLWQVADGKLRARCVGHHMQVVGSLFSPDSRRLLTFSIDATMRLWDVADGGEDAVFETHIEAGSLTAQPGNARWGAFSAHPMRLVTSQFFAIYDRDPLSGRSSDWQQRTSSPQAPFAVSPDGKIVVCSQDLFEAAAGSYEGTLRYRRKQQGTLATNPVVPQAPPSSSNASLMLTQLGPHGGLAPPPGGTPGGWRVLDDKYDYGRGGGPGFSRDGKHLYVSRWDAANRRFDLTVWDSGGWRIERVHRIQSGYPGAVLGFSPDGRFLVEAGLGYWDLRAGEWKKPQPELSDLPISSDISNDGSSLLRYGAVDGTLEVWDFKALERTFVVQPPEPED